MKCDTMTTLAKIARPRYQVNEKSNPCDRALIDRLTILEVAIVSIVGPALDSYAQNLYHLSRRESCESSRQTNKTGFSILKE